MTLALAPARPFEDPLTAELLAALKPDFLSTMSWDSSVRVLTFPAGHPLLGGPQCLVVGCEQMAFKKAHRGICVACWQQMERRGQEFEEFVANTVRSWRGIGISNCRVPDCARPWMTSTRTLCTTHGHQQENIFCLPVEEFIRHPDVRPLPGFGPCQVAACARDRHGRGPYCHAHTNRWKIVRRNGYTHDEETWRRTATGIAESGKVSLRGLPDRVVAELLYGLQQRYAEGIRQLDVDTRGIADLVRARQLGSLSELDPSPLPKNLQRLVRGILKHCDRSQLSPETERHKDTWDGAAFGFTGNLYFNEISQPWLREAAKSWAVDDVPGRRGHKIRNTVQSQITSLAHLSDSLRLNRADKGTTPQLLGREDVLHFLNRLRFLHEREEISAVRRCRIGRDVRRLLTRMRTLGLDQPGHPLHGLSSDFCLRWEDVPDDPEDTEAGHDLPPEVMRQLCDHLNSLGSGEDPVIRTVVELLMDTGRRPGEIRTLGWDCLERDSDGKPVLVYDNHKALRNGRRLPIPEATATVILDQQKRARARFPDTPVKDLKLLPSIRMNPDGTKPVSDGWISDAHRNWVNSLPDFLVPTVVLRDGERVTEMLPYDKANIFPYAYRHTYAQRHADAGVPIDVLRGLMDHRQLDTTQRYYRVGETRRREAIDRVTAMQFDRHGNRVWRQAKNLLDSEHARRAVGEVAVPYGVCSEPSNVAAGGHDCPVRFRCVGCGHFRTDVSYLPDLEAYLADLLRNRERLAAFADADSWAKGEAMPSDEEITRVRRLVRRVREDLDGLTDEDRTQIEQAVGLVHNSRHVVSLGMPKIRQPLPDLRPGRAS
ncbi:tyrosine-type recombinase/integrase [Streptomyces sp. NPDC048584]|uniref:tyrosine-type recombinase/integrase n=1 Tax=Streptomyces sp. NPDC048584 TaxID=3365573 RepID=UPI0037139239